METITKVALTGIALGLIGVALGAALWLASPRLAAAAVTCASEAPSGMEVLQFADGTCYFGWGGG